MLSFLCYAECRRAKTRYEYKTVISVEIRLQNRNSNLLDYSKVKRGDAHFGGLEETRGAKSETTGHD